jgi:hypothetical protein
MTHTQQGPRAERLDARIAKEHHIASPPGEHRAEATDARRPRWYHLRPQPRRRTDLMRFNFTWWMAVVWVVVILVVAYPFPWWW